MADYNPVYRRLDRSIRGKSAIITGAANGQGWATSILFAEEGAKVAVTDIDGEKAERVAEEIRRSGGEARAWRLDVSDKDQVRSVIAEVAEAFGGLDIVVNNAGLPVGRPFDADDYQEFWTRSLAVNLTGQELMASAALPYLRKSSSGRIVNIASTEAFGATPRNSAYVAAKHGIVGLTRALAVEFGREGVTVNCICPGAVHSLMSSGIPDEHKATFAKRRVPLGRYADPEEIAHMTLSICLPAASYLNGVVIPVDGGLTIKNA